MLYTEVGSETLTKELNGYLNGTKLSLSQVATKLGVSKGHLSEIKNAKATPALNTGLRILKLCGLSVDERRAWAHFYNKTISEEYFEVHESLFKGESKKLNEKASTLLARDLNLMNAYVDIVNGESYGVGLVELRIEYGRSIEEKLDKLVIQDIIAFELTDLGKFYKCGNCNPIITKNASYDLLTNVIRDEQMRFQSNDTRGRFKFHINDVTEQGHEKISELLENTIDEAQKIFHEHKVKPGQKGHRIFFNVMSAYIKNLLSLVLIVGLVISSQSNAFARSKSLPTNGGLSGGSSHVRPAENFLDNLDWEIILADDSYRVNWPDVYFAGEYTSLNNICHDPIHEKVKTQTPQRVCTSTKLVKLDCMGSGEYDQSNCRVMTDDSIANGVIIHRRECNEHSNKILEIDLSSTQKLFVRFNNNADDTRPSFQSINISDNLLTQEVEVYSLAPSTYGVSVDSLGKKEYFVPHCRL